MIGLKRVPWKVLVKPDLVKSRRIAAVVELQPKAQEIILPVDDGPHGSYQVTNGICRGLHAFH